MEKVHVGIDRNSLSLDREFLHILLRIAYRNEGNYGRTKKPDGGKERRRRGMGAGILLGICGTLVVGALGIYLTCRFTGSQILITNAAADTDGTTLLDAKTTAKINELSAYIDLYYYEDTDFQDLKDGLYA